MNGPASFLVLWLAVSYVAADIYETFDSVVVEVDDASADSDQETQDDSVTVKSELYIPGGPLERSCLTFDNLPGVCTPVQECYPYTKAHQLENLDTWVIGTKGTCNYHEPTGRQVYGVCCQRITERSFFRMRPFRNAIMERIVKGSNAYTGEWPFMAAIFMNTRLYCGGSLIDNIHILTAAHCLADFGPKDVARMSVMLGSTSSRKDYTSIVRRVRSVTRHKDFNKIKLYNDVALLTLEAPVDYTDDIGPVCLAADREETRTGDDAVVLGWGSLYDGGPRATNLQKVVLTIKDQGDCRRNFGSKAPGGIVDHMLCAAAPGKDACGGDSGGPLLVDNCQVGIVSWGIGCATDKYGVYTRVASFRNWIEKNRMKY